MNVHFSQTITMVHEVQHKKTVFKCTKQGQIRKSREIYTNQPTFSLTNIDSFFNISISMVFIRCPNLSVLTFIEYFSPINLLQTKDNS